MKLSSPPREEINSPVKESQEEEDNTSAGDGALWAPSPKSLTEQPIANMDSEDEAMSLRSSEDEFMQDAESDFSQDDGKWICLARTRSIS